MCYPSLDQTFAKLTNVSHVEFLFSKSECELCGATLIVYFITEAHIYMSHECHEYHTCEFCGKSFSQFETSKNHTLKMHKGHQDHKCECLF